MKRLLLVFGFAAFAFGQGRTVLMTWQDTENPAGTVYTIYRANGSCSITPAYSTIASNVAVRTYTDTGVSPGKYCYTVTANYGGEESVYADPAVAQVRPFKATAFTVVVQ